MKGQVAVSRKKKVTLSVLAKQLGLSEYTVSKALRGLPGMSEETRKEVIRLANELGYLTKEQENSLVYEGISRLSTKERRFLIVTASNFSATIESMFFGLKERLQELGHKISISFIPDKLSAADFPEWVRQEGIMYADGLFMAPLIPEDIEKLLLELELPRILINYPPVGVKVDSVIWDVYEATMQAVRYLIDNGHRNIMYLGNTSKTRGYRQRWLAFQEAMKQENMEIHEESHFIKLPYNDTQWMETFKSHIEKSEATALLCSSLDTNLSWVFYACSSVGRQIPEDLSIIVIDNIRDTIIPNITHPELLMSETGYRAADRMLWRIANPHLPFEHIRLQGTFFQGETVKNINNTQQKRN